MIHHIDKRVLSCYGAMLRLIILYRQCNYAETITILCCLIKYLEHCTRTVRQWDGFRLAL
jgi:hypothetical protein